jgi:hypothetical protein
MVAENEGEGGGRCTIVLFVAPDVQEAAERTARLHGVNLSDALTWWPHLLAVADWLPHSSEAALVKLWFAQGYPHRKEPPCQ